MAKRRQIRRWLLTILCAGVALPLLTSSHIRCLAIRAPDLLLYGTEGDADSRWNLSELWPAPGSDDNYIGTYIRFEQRLSDRIAVEVALLDDEGEEIGLEPWPSSSVWFESPDEQKYQPAQLLDPATDYSVEVLVCDVDEEDAPICEALQWDFATSDLGLPLEPGVDVSEVGYMLELTGVHLETQDEMVEYFAVGALETVGPLLVGLWPDGGDAALVVSQALEDVESAIPDPCLVTFVLEGAMAESPPGMTIEGIDLFIDGGGLYGGIRDIGGNVVVAPDGTRAYFHDVSAVVDSRLFDQFMIADGAVTCESPTLCTPSDARKLSLWAMGWQLKRRAREAGGDDRDDWFEGYSCTFLDCQECPDGSGPFCFGVVFEPMVAPAIEVPVPPRTLEEIAGDPEC